MRHIDPPWPSAARGELPRAVTFVVGLPRADAGTMLEHDLPGRGGPPA